MQFFTVAGDVYFVVYWPTIGCCLVAVSIVGELKVECWFFFPGAYWLLFGFEWARWSV